MLHGLVLVALLSADSAEVVARIDSATVTAGAAAARARALRQAGMSADPAAVLKVIVEDELLIAEAERRGLGSDPEVRRRVEALRRALASERFLRKEIDETISPDEATVKAAFHRSRDAARLDLVVLATVEDASAALERLRKGGSVAEESRRSFDRRSAAANGDTGLWSRAEMPPALGDAVFAAKQGAFGGPVALEIGFAVFRVRELAVANEAELAAQRDSLREYVAGRMRSEAKRHLQRGLRGKYKVTLDEKFLESTGTRSTGTPAELDHVVARAGGTKVLYRDVLGEVARISRGMEGPHASGVAVKKDVAWARVDQILLEEEALARGHDRAPEVQARLAAERRMILGIVLAERIRAVPEPNSAEVEAHYRRHLADYQRAAQRECSHIAAGSKDAALAIRKRIADGESFETLARHMSLDSRTSEVGGKLGLMSFDGLDAIAKSGEPALAAAIREAKPGEVTAPVQSRSGWHLLRCGPVTPAAPFPFDEVRPQVAARLRADRSDQALASAIAGLRSRAKITVDEERLGKAVAAAN
jgi:parvulin-like peptidyl-prolyl isomerase